MDWADDVAYAVHDVTDFFRAGIIPLELLASPSHRERQGLVAGLKKRSKLKEVDVNLLNDTPFTERYNGGREHRTLLRSWGDTLIARYVNGVGVKRGTVALQIPNALRREVALLKELTWHYVILNPSLATQQHGQKKIVTTLFETFLKASKTTAGQLLFPYAFRELIEKCRSERQIKRVVIDFIASMTERQAERLYMRLAGAKLGSILEGQVR